MRKKDLSKLIALAVVLGGVTCSSSAWAEGTTIKIGASSTDPSTYSTAAGVGVDASGANRVLGSYVDKIVTWGDSTEGGAISVAAGVYGIKTVDSTSYSVTADSIVNGINVNCSNQRVWGIYLGSSGSNEINNLGNITVNEGGAADAKGIEAKAGTNIITFKGDTKFINVESTGSWKKYGMYLGGGTNYIGTDANGATGGELDSIMVGGTGSGSAYGIVAGGGENTLAFAGSDSFIAVNSSSDAYGVGFCNVGTKGIDSATGTTTIKNLGSVTAEVTGEDKNAYGIYAKGKTENDGLHVTFSGVNSSITATSSQGFAYGIKLEGAGTNSIENLGSIKAVEGKPAYGICISGNSSNTVTFAGTDRSITAKGGNEADGIVFYDGANNIGTGSGKELTTIRVGFTDEKDTEIQKGGAYGIRAVGGTNTVAFGVDSSIAAKTDGSDAFGIAYGDINKQATGKTKITGLGSIVAETYEDTEGPWAFGIYVENGNPAGEASADATFSVAFDSVKGGSISAYSALGTARNGDISGNYGICFYSAGDETGKSEILNVKTITAGVQSGSNPEKITSGNSCGICAQAGVNTVTFTGTDSSIMVQSSGTIDKDEQPIFARGIYVEDGSNTITNLENIVAKGAGGSYGILIYGGKNNIDIGDGQKLKNIRAGFTSDSDIQAGVAYGICAEYGTNNIAFGSESSVVAKSSGSDAYGISLTGGNGANHTISGLGSVTAEAKGESANAYGIYSVNFHEAPVSSEEAATFSVTMVDGSISAYSASGENYGIKFNDGSTGKSEVLNVKSITAGVDPDNPTDPTKYGKEKSFGIFAQAGVNIVTFTGADSSITVKSSGEAYGVYAEGGTNTITGLGKIDVTLSVDQGYVIYSKGGSLTLGFAKDGLGLINVVNNETSPKDGISVVGVENSGSIIIKNLKGIEVDGPTCTKLAVASGTITLDNSTIAEIDGVKTIGAYTDNSNTLNLTNNTKVSGPIELYGSLDLNVDNSSQWHVNEITGTDTLNVTNSGKVYIEGKVSGNINLTMNNGAELIFDIPGDFDVAKDVMLTTTNDTALNFGDGNTIKVINGKATQLQEGDEVCLIDSSQTITLDNNVVKQDSSDGITWSEAEIYLKDTDDSRLIYKMGKRGLDPDGSKAPVEGMAAAAAVININTDLALGAGISNLITSTAAVNSGMETFGAANYGKARLNTGSHVDAKGYGIMVGVGKKVFSKAGNKTTGGLYFEYGNSDFDTYNGSVTGSGKGIQKGVGYMMRWDNKSGNYYEGMLHGGKVTTNWSNSNGSYDVSPTYFGGAATYGHKFMLGEDKQLSVYGSYIYNRIGGSDAKIDKYDYNFDATRSHRTKVGVRYAVSDLMDTKKFRPYIGLAWEHEFDGESNASFSAIKGSFNGRPESPSMKGDSGILELGCKQEVGKWTLGIGAEIFAGKRRGWNGTLNAIYNF